MKARKNKILSAMLLLSLAVFTNGCNLFEAVETSVNTTTSSDLISEGNDKLAEADYATALDRFERALEKETCDEAFRGRASAYAGLSGFNMFAALDDFQNGVVAPNSSAVVFQASKKITNLNNLNKAIEDMASLHNPTKEDMLFRALMASMSAAKTIITKYDTNMNMKLDAPDQVDFTTNDKKTMTWPELYSNLSSNSPYSLEKAYIELTVALDGRGTSWTTMSPFNSVSKSGTYTQANYNTIEAVGNLGLQLKAVNLRYNNSVSDFKLAILALDGAN